MSFAEDVRVYLTQYSWPGNVRELDNAIQRSLILASNGLVQVADFCLDSANTASWILEATEPVQTQEPDSVIELDLESELMSGLGKDLKLKEYQIIIDTLKQENGKKKNAAEKLGISPRTLRYKLAQMRDNGIDVRAKLSA